MREEAMVNAIRSRDEEVMAKIVRKYSRLLWPIAWAVLHSAGSEQDVEECIADTFIYLWEHPEKFDPERGGLKTLLCIIVRSRAIDRYREIMRRNSVPIEEAVMSVGVGVQDELLQKETRLELLTAVKMLEEPNREILVRRYYHDQKPKEIALALGLTVKQVDNSLYRSKRQLREALMAKGGTK